MFSHVAATIQLPLVSVTQLQLQKGSNVTLALPSEWESCCKDDKCECVTDECATGPSHLTVTVTGKSLNINNLVPGINGTYKYCRTDTGSEECRFVKIGELFNPLTSCVISTIKLEHYLS